MCVCVCVCVCVRACVRACVYACMRVCLPAILCNSHADTDRAHTHSVQTPTQLVRLEAGIDATPGLCQWSSQVSLALFSCRHPAGVNI